MNCIWSFDRNAVCDNGVRFKMCSIYMFQNWLKCSPPPPNRDMVWSGFVLYSRSYGRIFWSSMSEVSELFSTNFLEIFHKKNDKNPGLLMEIPLITTFQCFQKQWKRTLRVTTGRTDHFLAQNKHIETHANTGICIFRACTFFQNPKLAAILTLPFGG